MDGNSVEGSVASILFDIVDSGNAADESLNSDFGTVFHVLTSNNVKSIADFYTAWNNGNREELRRIYHTYGVDKNDPPKASDVAPPAASDASWMYQSGWANPPSCCGITVTASTSDPNNDAIQKVRFWYSTDGGSSWTVIGTDADGSDGWQVRWDDSITITQADVVVKAKAYDGMEWGPATTSSKWKLDNSRPGFPKNLDDGKSEYTNSQPVTFTWDQPTDEGSGIAGYYYGHNTDPSPQNELSDPTQTSKTLKGLSDGEHTFYLTAFDGAGHDNGPVEETVKIDTVAPDTGVSVEGQTWTNDSTVTLEAEDRIGSSASVSPAGVAEITWRLDGEQSRESGVSATVTIPDGKHTLGYSAVDKSGSGNIEEQERIEVWVDTEAPSQPYSKSTPSGWVSEKTVSINWESASDSLSGVASYEVKVDDGEWKQVSGTSTSLSLTTGEHRISVRAVDNAGNRGQAVTQTVKVDPTQPVVSISSPTEGSSLSTSDVTVRGEATDSESGIQNIEIKIDDGRWTEVGTAAGSWSESVSLTEGTHTVTVRVTNNAGQSVTTAVNMTVATGSISPDITANQTTVTPEDPVELDASGSLHPQGETLRYDWDLDNDSQFDDASGSTAVWSFSETGTHTVSVSVSDGTETVTTSMTVTVESTGGNASIEAVRSVPTTATPGDTVNATVNITIGEQ